VDKIEEDYCKNQLESSQSKEFLKHLESIKESSARIYFKQIIRSRAISSAAKVLGCTKVFGNESSSEIALKIISGICKWSNILEKLLLLKPLILKELHQEGVRIWCMMLDSKTCQVDSWKKNSKIIAWLMNFIIIKVWLKYCVL